MVEAVPMVMQWPIDRATQDSASQNWAGVIKPALISAWNFHMSVPEPMVCPR